MRAQSVFKKIEKNISGKIIFLPKRLGKKLTPIWKFTYNLLKVGLFVGLILFIYQLAFFGRIYPNIYITAVDVSGLTPEEATSILEKRIKEPKKVTIVTSDQSFDIDLTQLEFSYDFEKSAYSAYGIYRTGNVVYDIVGSVKSLWEKTTKGVRIDLNEEKLKETLSVLGGQIATEPVYPSLTFVDKQIVIKKGRAGADVDLTKLRAQIGEAISYTEAESIRVDLEVVDPTISDQEVEVLRKRAENLLGKSLKANFEFTTFTFNETEIFLLIDPKNGYSEAGVEALATTVASQIEREPQNAVFSFSDGKVTEFAPSKPGVALDTEKFVDAIEGKLRELETTDGKIANFEIPTKLTEPAITNESVNNLGIRELIGRGSSRFRGSIPTRVYNVNLAATRLNGALIKPGDTFSFNDALGDVSKLTGYKEAYIIKDGKTVLGDGGGVCQVSTTLFRAVLNAGLPIAERRAHAYRVGYYEQDSGPGLDATVYSPTTDFKFVNDTPAHILIQAYPDTKNLTLVFELYGTSDGRVATTTKPITTGVTPPPEDLYQDDPTLPSGTIKQVEHKAWGAKTVFDYKVERDGQVIYEKTFVSNYRPWQAVYLRGTGPAQ